MRSRALRLIAFLSLFSLVENTLMAASVQSFEPLADTLTRYKILKVPEAADYPGIPAVALLSRQEYRQFESRHEKRFHKILKILTSAGKEYTTLKIPCFSACRIDARTIKSDGKVIPLPGRDMVRTEKLTDYSAPYFLAQFAMPAVEAGDIVEYSGTVEYPYPFYLDDFRFGEPFPTIKAMLVLSHSAEYSYTYLRQSPQGSFPIQTFRDQFQEGHSSFIRTIFVVENTKAVAPGLDSLEIRQTQPGVRILIESQNRRQFEAFRDWWNYGAFIAKQAGLARGTTTAVRELPKEILQQKGGPQTILNLVYREAERRIQIVRETLPESGFVFRNLEEVLKSGIAAPHDFALLMASWCRPWKWQCDLILVNSQDQPDAAKDAPFPLDLDLVLLKVKTPSGEFLIDCNRNGMPPGVLSSKSLNRFGLGVPLASPFRTVNTVYTTKVPVREANRSHLEVRMSPSGDVWNMDLRWILAGEYQADFLRTLRQSSETEMRNKIGKFLREQINVDRLTNIDYRLQSMAIELRATGVRTRRKANNDLELLQNEFWNSGFDIRPDLFENRTGHLLLPAVGEISSSYRIQLPSDMQPLLPPSYQASCGSVRYHLSFEQQNREVHVEEKILISDLVIMPPLFQEFSRFLNGYQENHFWSILMSRQ